MYRSLLRGGSDALFLGIGVSTGVAPSDLGRVGLVLVRGRGGTERRGTDSGIGAIVLPDSPPVFNLQIMFNQRVERWAQT